jgi:hypothetical protein
MPQWTGQERSHNGLKMRPVYLGWPFKCPEMRLHTEVRQYLNLRKGQKWQKSDRSGQKSFATQKQ